MNQSFSVHRLRRSPNSRRLTGITVAMFDQMLGQLQELWDAEQRRKRKPAQ